MFAESYTSFPSVIADINAAKEKCFTVVDFIPLMPLGFDSQLLTTFITQIQVAAGLHRISSISQHYNL